MTTIVTGVFVDGVVRLDEAVDVPNNSRVTVHIASIENPPSTALTAWQELKQRLVKRPIDADGRRFTRDERYERR